VSETINCAGADWPGTTSNYRYARLILPSQQRQEPGGRIRCPRHSHSPEAAQRAPSSAVRYQAAHPSEETQALAAPLGYFLDGDGYFWNIFVTALSTS